MQLKRTLKWKNNPNHTTTILSSLGRACLSVFVVLASAFAMAMFYYSNAHAAAPPESKPCKAAAADGRGCTWFGVAGWLYHSAPPCHRTTSDAWHSRVYIEYIASDLRTTFSLGSVCSRRATFSTFEALKPFWKSDPPNHTPALAWVRITANRIICFSCNVYFDNLYSKSTRFHLVKYNCCCCW